MCASRAAIPNENTTNQNSCSSPDSKYRAPIFVPKLPSGHRDGSPTGIAKTPKWALARLTRKYYLLPLLSRLAQEEKPRGRRGAAGHGDWLELSLHNHMV